MQHISSLHLKKDALCLALLLLRKQKGVIFSATTTFTLPAIFLYCNFPLLHFCLLCSFLHFLLFPTACFLDKTKQTMLKTMNYGAKSYYEVLSIFD